MLAGGLRARRAHRAASMLEVLLERVVVFLFLLGLVLRQPSLPLLFHHLAIVFVRRHHEGRQLALKVLAMAGRALGRAAARPHEELEDVLTGAAFVVVKRHTRGSIPSRGLVQTPCRLTCAVAPAGAASSGRSRKEAQGQRGFLPKPVALHAT